MQLGDPFEPERDYVYEATQPNPSVVAFVFDPDGKLVAKRVKSYITPTELGPGRGRARPRPRAGRGERLRQRARRHAGRPVRLRDLEARVDARRAPEDRPAPHGPAAPARVLRGRPDADDRHVEPGHAARLGLQRRAAPSEHRDARAPADGGRRVQLLRRPALAPRGQAAHGTREEGLHPRPAGAPRARADAAVGRAGPDRAGRADGRAAEAARRGGGDARAGLRRGVPGPGAAGTVRGRPHRGRPVARHRGEPQAAVPALPRQARADAVLARRSRSRRSRRAQRNVAVAARGRHVVAAYEERRGGRDQVFVVAQPRRRHDVVRARVPHLAGRTPTSGGRRSRSARRDG